MSPQRKNSAASFISVIVWIMLAVICIQGYLLISKKGQPTSKPVVTAPAPVEPKKTSFFKLPVFKKKNKPVQVQKVKTQPQPVVPEVTGHIAIVIDDWGYNRSHCKMLADIEAPAGVAILPHLSFSRDMIQCAVESGKEPMLHLPLEPQNMREAFDADYLLTTQMAPSVVKKQLQKILNDMPGVVGVNNHTGSRGTEDDVLMTLILAELKRRGLFFVDSFTTEHSVCGDVAGKLKMRIARRDVFLDNRNERAAIEREFAKAARIAKRNGYALIIGHDRALTLQIIKEQVQKLSEQGYRFISVREYIRQYEYPRN